NVNRPDGGAWDISGDGRFVMFNKQNDIYVQDRADPTAIPVQVDAALPFAAPIDAAELSADGHHVVIVSDSPTSRTGLPRRTSVFHLDTGTTDDIREFSNVNKPFTGVGISSDGTSLSLMLDVPTETEWGLENAPGMFVWRNGAVTELSAPNGARPNGAVTDGFLTADGTAVVFQSQAENLVAGTTNPYNVYIRKLGVPPAMLPSGPWSGQSVDVPAAFTPAAAARMLDTRTGAMPPAGTTLTLPSAGHFGIPADATAVAVQVTATDGTGVGFVGLAPSGGTPGTTSNLNVDVPGETIANSAIVPIGSDGSITVHTSLPTHLIVDLLGWWRPAGPVAAGRFESAQPTRVLDTRPGSLVGYEGAKPAASSTTIVQIAGRNGVPSSGVGAVIVNITVADGEAPGFVQAAAADALVPGATSTLNIAAANRTAAAVSIVPVDASGRIALYSQPSTHLIVDVLGWLTDGTAPVSTSGRFVPFTSVTRLLDTRAATRVGWTGSKPQAASTLVVSTTRVALVGNLTITETDAAGFVQLGPAASLTPGATSSVNASGSGETVANAFISDTTGGLGLYAMMGTHVVIDISGYMTS
ncbi:MAG: polysaccharide deacetylase, partial [Ilumatobacteraceae bacterium]|nr:polysaccharide deacetylase [Ilumatobacteraceae bacterium]